MQDLTPTAPALDALVADLQEEVDMLLARLRRAG